MTITLEVNGTEFKNFTRASASISLTQFVNTFSFGSTSDEPQKFPVTVGAPVRVLIGDTSIVTGFIEAINGGHSPTGRSINIQGVSKTVDVIDTTVDQTSFIAPIGLAGVIIKTLEQAGIKDISVSSNAGSLETFKKDDLIKIGQGQSVYSFLEQFARKRQVFLITDGDGNIVITKNSGAITKRKDIIFAPGGTAISKIKLLSRFNDNNNNVISANVTTDNQSRYNRYIAVSQDNLKNVDISSVKQATNQRGEAIDEDIRSNRTLIFQAETASSTDDLIERAKWEANLRRAGSLTYNAAVPGHLQNIEEKEPWRLNQIITVIDDFEAINAQMLIDQITFNQSLDAGEITEIRCVKPDSYTQQATETDKQKKLTQFGPDEDPEISARFS